MISEENLSLLDADVLLIAPRDDQGLGFLDPVTSTPLYQNLNAVKNGRDIALDPNENRGLTWALATFAPLCTTFALASIVPKIDSVLE